MTLRFLFAALVSAGLTGCGSTIVTRIAPPPAQGRAPSVAFVRPGGEPSRSLKGPALARALVAWAGRDSTRLELAAALVLRQAASAPSRDSAGDALLAAQLAWRSLAASGLPAAQWPGRRPAALATYNDSLDIFVTERAREIAAGAAMEIETPDGVVHVGVKYPQDDVIHAGYFDRLLAADRMDVRGFRERARVGDFGVAMVGERERTPGREAEMDLQPPGTGVIMPVSGVLRFESGRRATFEIFDPTETIDVPVDGGHLALAADFTAPFALSFSEINDLWLGIRGLLNVGAFEENAGVYLTEPFNPGRIPVLLIHGLSSSPLVWRNVATDALRDPAIREHFQFWYAYYPTGAPLVQSAAWIRDAMADIRRKHDPAGTSVASRHLAVVGYSMGGNIARILSTDIGDRLWNEISRRPLEDLPLDAADEAMVRDWVFWEAVPGVELVVFIATPHRGSSLVDMSFAQLGSRLVRLPGDIIGFQKRLIYAIGDAFDGDLSMTRVQNGVNSLSPESPMYRALNDAPFAPGVRLYSVIGDRGRGDSPNSSDGVVPYSSTHLDGVVEQLIVPTGHDAQTHPETEALIQRALLSLLPRDRDRHTSRPAASLKTRTKSARLKGLEM